MNRICTATLGVLLVCQPLAAQEDEYKYGLVGTYSGTGGRPVRRIDADLAFDWREGAPDPLVAPPFEAHWEGQVLIRELTPYRFSAHVSGELTVVIDGRTVLDASTTEPAWVSGKEVDLDPGFQELEVTYRSTRKGAVLKLFWSSEQFSLEPVPPHLLFYEQDDAQIQLAERGRLLFDAHRCHRCHDRTPAPSAEDLPAPSLTAITSGTNPEWIVEKLLGGNVSAAHDKMPEFGLSREEAEDLAAFLHRRSQPVKLQKAPDVKPPRNGPTANELLYSMGCLACHTVGDLGHAGAYAGGDLSLIARKRSPDWLATWLATPEKLNPQHRMPVFALSRTEQGLLVQALSRLGQQKGVNFGVDRDAVAEARVERGAALVRKFNCASCHQVPDVEPDRRDVASLKEPVEDWSASCLSERPDPERRRPFYPHLDRPALKAYLQGRFGTEVARLSPFERGRGVLERKNCLSCHGRGTGKGFLETAGRVARQVDELQGESQALIPPSLTAIGDKLREEVLDKALSGEQDRVRASWLKTRMPRFHHTPEELAALKSYFVGHDRIPSAGRPGLPVVELSDDDALVTGRQLIGAGGFSCIACHQVGDYVPRNVALGTRGSDLMGIANRLRPEFYFRWTKAPIRIIPGMEMPSYQKPVPGVLGDDADLQLATVWQALHDPRFEAPANPSQVEQFWQLAADAPPRIVRDVFTLAEENGGGYVPRALAIGLPNQHGMLFDLDAATLREWRFGDFAQQRTVGKSWYWDLAGTHVATGFTETSDFVLLREKDERVVPLTPRHPDRLARLSDYHLEGATVTFRYEMDATIGEKPFTLRVEERIRPVQSASRSGWERHVTAEGPPSGYRLAFVVPPTLAKRFDARIAAGGGPEATRRGTDDVGRGTNAPPGPLLSAVGPEGLSIEYTSGVVPPPVAAVEREIPPAPDDPVTTLPGYRGRRLPLPSSIMPTAITWDSEGRLVFTSLKGHVYRALDADGDGLEETLQIIDEGLAGPFGIMADGNDLLVAHKPELLRLIDGNGDGRAERREVVADGWGYTDDYHDWITGPVRDDSGNLFVAVGSDYAQRNRPETHTRWRGKVLKIDSSGNVSPYAHELRYPIGIALDARGRLFVSDQQGVQNTFNEINHVVEGGRYGVPAKADPRQSEEMPVAVQIPHPWTRSVNGIFFLPEDHPGPFAGHGIGCEFNSRFLIRYTLEEVDGVLQGATYPFSRTEWAGDENTFLGPICGAVAPGGDIYIGSLYDSGWLGGRNTGEIVRLSPQGEIPNGIREVRAIRGGFEIEFVRAVDPEAARNRSSYSLSGYTRVWQGSYGTDDSGRYSPEIEAIHLSGDGRTVTLHLAPLKTGFVYEINVREIGSGGESLFPTFATYTLNRLAE